MMSLDEALAELRRCDAESRLESQEVRAVIANGVISGRLIPAAALAEARAEVERLREETATLRCALITWRNTMEGGNHEGLCVAYEIGNDALGVPAELRAPASALRAALAHPIADVERVAQGVSSPPQA